MPADGASDADVLAWLRAEHDRPFSGWDFSPLGGRRTNSKAPWDFEDTLVAAASGCSVVLDVDTGEGRVLADLHRRGVLPPLAAATENHAPNVALAAARLAPMGARVVQAAPEGLPFRDGSFDLVANRHGGVEAREVARVLRPGGVFVTQQVGSAANRDIHRLLGTEERGTGPSPTDEWDLAVVRGQVEAAGLRVERAEEAFPVTRYADVGAVARYLKAVPWEVPNFAVDRYADRLIALHRRVAATGEPIEVGFHLILLVATRPA